MNGKIFLVLVVLYSFAMTMTGCSFSDSSKSSSDSSGSSSDLVSSPLESSSESSKTQQEKYQRDVKDYTAEYVRSSRGDLDTFRSRLGELAKRRGITHWENDESTYFAIGKGLRKADLGKPQFESFKETLSNADPRSKSAIERGYHN
jgi:hypothetical protein